MATWILMNEVIVGATPGGAVTRHFPGELINDQQVPTAQMIAAGAILWPSSDPIMSAMQAIVVQLKLRGQGQGPKISEYLLAGALYSLMGGQGGQLLGPTGVGAGQLAGLVQKATFSLGFAQLTTAATSMTFNLSPSLPANARILSRELRCPTGFTGGGLTTFTASVGVAAAPTEIINAQSIFTAVGNIPGTAGADPNPLLATAGPLQLVVTGSGNVNLATAGAVVVDVLYTVLP